MIRWFAPILSFTTEEIFKLICKNKKSIHLESFKKIPNFFYDEELDKKWSELKRIREICNFSIEEKRTTKEIGSSLEAKLEIKLNKQKYNEFKNIDFAELCITSSAEIIENTIDQTEVSTIKALGKKCSLCWKLKQKKCERNHCGLQEN